jgi:hypothetical protein
MKSAGVSVFLCAIAGLIAGWPSVPNKSESFHIERPRPDEVHIPFQYDNYGFLPTIEMQMDGRVVRSAVDTGFEYGMIQLDSSLVEELSLKTTEPRDFDTFDGLLGNLFFKEFRVVRQGRIPKKSWSGKMEQSGLGEEQRRHNYRRNAERLGWRTEFLQRHQTGNSNIRAAVEQRCITHNFGQPLIVKRHTPTYS